MTMKAWLKDSETNGSFQWLSKQEQGFQVYCFLFHDIILYHSLILLFDAPSSSACHALSPLSTIL